MNSALRNSGHHAAARPNEFGPTKPRNRETAKPAAAPWVFVGANFIRTRLSALRRGRWEADRDAEPLAVETFAQRNLRAVPIGDALDDRKSQTAAADARALGSVLGG